MNTEKHEIKCIIHGLPGDLIPFVLAESHYGKINGIIHWVNLKSFELRKGHHLDGWFTVENVTGMSTRADTATPDGDGHMFNMEHTIWSSDTKFGDELNDNMLTTKEMVDALNLIGYKYYTPNPNGACYAMTFQLV